MERRLPTGQATSNYQSAQAGDPKARLIFSFCLLARLLLNQSQFFYGNLRGNLAGVFFIVGFPFCY